MPDAIRRCRPLLGTFVEISAAPSPRAQAAIEAAFVAVEKIHHLMSLRNPDSDLVRLNCSQPGTPVKIARETAAVLRLASRVQQATEGLFNPDVGARLQQFGLLPAGTPTSCRPEAPASCRPPQPTHTENGPAFEILDDTHARLTRPAMLDLGGIAKGYAVDQAAQVLANANITQGLINAGGDLRFVGDMPRRLHLRHPSQPNLLLPIEDTPACAVATSSACFSVTEIDGQKVNALIHPHTGQVAPEGISVSVFASKCALADALTKPVLFAPVGEAQMFLRSFHALALILDAAGETRWLGD